MYLYFCAIVFISTFVHATERGASCTTPYGERATCISILSCPGLIDVLLTKNKPAIEYAVQFQCGYDTEPLVCCRFSDYPPGTFDAFAKPQTPTSVVQTEIDKNFFIDDFSELDIPEVKTCGKDDTKNRISSSGRADWNEFPWLVALVYKNIFTNKDAGIRCSGSIVNKRFILTAAQCVTNREFYITDVWLGDWKLSTDPGCEDLAANSVCTDKVQKFKVAEFIPHPFFSNTSGNNDIALIKLANDIRYTDFIQPICLPPPHVPVPTTQTPFITAGWARRSRASSDNKLKESVRMLPNRICEETYENRLIGPNQMCAARKLEKIIRQGDPGGPLMRTCRDEVYQQTRWYQEGVGSWDDKHENVGGPFVYTRVSRYIRWITNIIKKDRTNRY